MKGMRIFFLLLMFAIGFSGFSAAVPAFAASWDHAHVEESVTDSGVVDAQNDEFDHHSKNAPCLDCMHCCAAHITFSQPNAPVKFEPQTAILGAFVDVYDDSGYRLSLLRPPQSLI